VSINESNSPINKIPAELICTIAGFLPLSACNNFTRVSKKINGMLFEQQQFWEDRAKLLEIEFDASKSCEEIRDIVMFKKLENLRGGKVFEYAMSFFNVGNYRLVREFLILLERKIRPYFDFLIIELLKILSDLELENLKGDYDIDDLKKTLERINDQIKGGVFYSSSYFSGQYIIDREDAVEMLNKVEKLVDFFSTRENENITAKELITKIQDIKDILEVQKKRDLIYWKIVIIGIIAFPILFSLSMLAYICCSPFLIH